MPTQGADERKLKELILYIDARMREDRHAGQGPVKLAKLLWLSDFEAYRRIGRSITGTTYVSAPLGPEPVDGVPEDLDSERSSEPALDVAEGHQGLPSPRRPPPAGLFSPNELALVDEILNRYERWTGRQLVDLAHEHPGSLLVEPGEDVPYESVFISSEPPPPAAVELGRRLIREGRWGSASV
jgi:hypothetical protein